MSFYMYKWCDFIPEPMHESRTLAEHAVREAAKEWVSPQMFAALAAIAERLNRIEADEAALIRAIYQIRFDGKDQRWPTPEVAQRELDDLIQQRHTLNDRRIGVNTDRDRLHLDIVEHHRCYVLRCPYADYFVTWTLADGLVQHPVPISGWEAAVVQEIIKPLTPEATRQYEDLARRQALAPMEIISPLLC